MGTPTAAAARRAIVRSEGNGRRSRRETVAAEHDTRARNRRLSRLGARRAAPGRRYPRRHSPAGNCGPGTGVGPAPLSVAARSPGGRAPRLLGADPDGQRFSEPATLITRLPGRSGITPASPDAAAAQLGRTLARLHRVPLAQLAGLRDGMEAATVPYSRARTAAPASMILASHGHRLAEQAPVLTHYD
ncbi:phosphotransferase, partial [Streptomyces sp. NPDC001941]|uniref:phosphotransferase n=1 Tax=Streptomyces sp. NPDC001941 TaxID=3154659 RepID=UPI003326845F